MFQVYQICYLEDIWDLVKKVRISTLIKVYQFNDSILPSFL